jgi:glycosidase
MVPALPERYTRSHLPEPDYSRPLLEVAPEAERRIVGLLERLYGPERAAACWPELLRLMRVYYAHKPPEMVAEEASFDPAQRFDERDVILITYGDLLLSPGQRPLHALGDFLDRFTRGGINTIHILPFFPYSSDRGFAIVDFEEVDPRLGSWQDLEQLSRRYRMMFDGVFNHASSKSRWFQRFLNGRPGYEDFFVSFNTRDAIDPDHLRLILRPRTSDLLTLFRSIHGSRWVWTTFSPDQVDLNFRNEKVLMKVLEVLMLYVRRGADIIRLDAVTYIWRELGTSCAHLGQTHALVQLFRAVLDAVAPQVALVTETNVPHLDNISYFGDGRNEAQMVYNFALPPLVLNAFHEGDCQTLARWASTLGPISDTATYFNFLDSHDGIGLLGARGLLAEAEIEALVCKAQEHGGLVSYRDNGDGTRSPYELNITWYSALNREGSDEPQRLQVARFIASRSIAIALRGVPGVYLPSLFGAKNDTAAALSGRDARSINRRTIDHPSLFALLEQRSSWVHQVAVRMRRLIRRRMSCAAFHPNASQRVLFVSPAVFALLRETADGAERVLALTNVTAAEQRVAFRTTEIGGAPAWRDLLSGRQQRALEGVLELLLRPYEVVWLRAGARLPRS